MLLAAGLGLRLEYTWHYQLPSSYVDLLPTRSMARWHVQQRQGSSLIKSQSPWPVYPVEVELRESMGNEDIYSEA